MEVTIVDCLLMHKDNPVLRVELDDESREMSSGMKTFAPERLPIGVNRRDGLVGNEEFNDWWMKRSIPFGREGLAKALEAMKIQTPEDLPAKCLGLSLTDRYWIKPENSDLSWEKVNFFDNPFSKDVGDILFGKIPGNDGFDPMSPDNTTDGRLSKRWIIIDGKRCLIKGGSGMFRQEPHNEVLASEIARRLDIPCVPYSVTLIDDFPHSVCENFVAAETELVKAWSILQIRNMRYGETRHGRFLKHCEDLGIPGVRPFLDKMLALDYLVANGDRHYFNFGALRDVDTLEWIGFAPLFDSGLSLWHDRPNSEIDPRSGDASYTFASRHEEQIKLVSDFDWLDFKALAGIDEVFREILSGSPFADEERRDALCRGLSGRVEMLERHASAGKRSGK
jgi:hypothetical protein